MDPLDHIIAQKNADAYVIFASSVDPDMRYLTGFTASDPFVFIKKKGALGVVIVSQMEYARAVHEAKTAVMTRTAAGLPGIMEKEKDAWKATALMIAGQADGTLLVPPEFPLKLARALETERKIVIDETGLVALRAIKKRGEIKLIRHVQECTEAAIRRAVTLIKRSRIRNGILSLKDKPLTSERIRAEMHRLLIDRGCWATDTIVSCGKDAAIPHELGSGPLQAHEPIVIDLFPQDEKTGYFSDMTRTFVKGTPSTEIRDMYTAVVDAHDLAVSSVRAGANGAEIHGKVTDLFKERGYESGMKGFVHNLGHGVGLEIHEEPSLGPNGGPLASGNVVTIEPGLYYPKVGGVRLEDIGLVTRRGFTVFTKYPVDLVL